MKVEASSIEELFEKSGDQKETMIFIEWMEKKENKYGGACARPK